MTLRLVSRIATLFGLLCVFSGSSEADDLFGNDVVVDVPRWELEIATNYAIGLRGNRTEEIPFDKSDLGQISTLKYDAKNGDWIAHFSSGEIVVRNIGPNLKIQTSSGKVLGTLTPKDAADPAAAVIKILRVANIKFTTRPRQEGENDPATIAAVPPAPNAKDRAEINDAVKAGRAKRLAEARAAKRAAAATAQGANAVSAPASEPVPTPMIDKVAVDITALARAGELPKMIGRDKEVAQVVRSLSRVTKNSPVLLGEPGVGKTAIAEGLAQRIAAGKVPPALRGYRVASVSISSLLSDTKYTGQLEDKLKPLLEEAESAKVILFIDEIHMVKGAGTSEKSDIDVANLLKSAMARGKLKIVGATTLAEYRILEKDGAFERRLQPVHVLEPSPDETIAILKQSRARYEHEGRTPVSDAVIRAAVRLADRYVRDRYFPDKAIDFIDEAAAGRVQLVTGRKKQPVTPDDIARVVAEKRQIPLSDALALAAGKSKAEADLMRAKIGQLTPALRARVVGQDHAIEAIDSAVQREAAHLRDPKMPIGSYLFLGPTGVGKSELAKALAGWVSDERDIVQLNMNEFTSPHSITRLLGDKFGNIEQPGALTEPLRKKPYRVILLDEIEKAHPDVQKVLLSILNGEKVTDGTGRVIDFSHTHIVMTTNAGVAKAPAKRSIGFLASGSPAAPDGLPERDQIEQELAGHFLPEFLNRIDHLVPFHSMTPEILGQIVDGELEEVGARGLKISVSPAAKALLAKKGYNPVMGARPLKRVVSESIVTPISRRMNNPKAFSAEGHYGPKSTVHVDVAEDGRLSFRTKIR